MSRILVSRIDIRPWRGYDNPSYPAGQWIGENDLEGDVSGGFLDIQFLLQQASLPLSARLFSVENVLLHVTEETANVWMVGTFQMDNLGPARPLNPKYWGGNLTPLVGAGLSFMEADRTTHPVFIGRARGGGFASGVELYIQNPGAGNFLRGRIQGFYWEPDALLAPDGLRRPADALWG